MSWGSEDSCSHRLTGLNFLGGRDRELGQAAKVVRDVRPTRIPRKNGHTLFRYRSKPRRELFGRTLLVVNVTSEQNVAASHDGRRRAHCQVEALPRSVQTNCGSSQRITLNRDDMVRSQSASHEPTKATSTPEVDDSFATDCVRICDQIR